MQRVRPGRWRGPFIELLSSQQPTPVPVGPKSGKIEDTTFGCDIDQVYTSVRCCKVERGTLKTAPGRIYQEIAVKSAPLVRENLCCVPYLGK